MNNTNTSPSPVPAVSLEALQSPRAKKNKVRYPSLRHVRRIQNDGPCYDNGYADAFYVIAHGFHHGYGKRMKFYCFSSDSLDRAIELRDRYAKAWPEHRVRIRFGVNDGTFWDGVTLSL